MIATVALLTECPVFKGVTPGGVVAFLTGIELVKFMGGEWSDAKEGMKKDLRVFIIGREDGIDRERGERDVDDDQCG